MNQVFLGECVAKLNEVAAKSVDLVFADPPFNIGYTYDVYDDTKSAKEYLKWSQSWMKGIHRCLRDDGTFWLAIGDEFAAELKLAAQEIGFHTRSWVIWYYTFGVNVKSGFSRSHTHLFHLVKDPRNFTFNEENPQIRVPSARQLVYADSRANPNGRLPDNTWILRPQDIPDSFTGGENSWYFPRVAGTFKEREGFHGCQMPERLLARIIRASSNPGEVVLDPFAGSGTTVVVAKKLARRWLGFDVSSDYVSHMKKRLKKTRIGDDLDGVENPLKSAPKTSAGKRRTELGKGSQSGGKSKSANQEKDLQQVKKIVAKAYLKSHQGMSTDHVLADPEINKAFVATCKSLGAEGYPRFWNETLIGLRKQGKLPKQGTNDKSKIKRLTNRDMDSYSYASEIAIQLAETDFGYNLDKLFCVPELAAKFDELAAQFAPGFTSFEYRWAAIAFRKKAKVAKLAGMKASHWATADLPRPLSLRKLKSAAIPEAAGVYVILGEDRSELYVGQTFNLRERLEQITSVLTWQELNPKGIQFIDTGSEDTTGVKVALASRFRARLNSRMIFLDQSNLT